MFWFEMYSLYIIISFNFNKISNITSSHLTFYLKINNIHTFLEYFFNIEISGTYFFYYNNLYCLEDIITKFP